MAKLLIVESSDKSKQTLKDYLATKSYSVAFAQDKENLLQMIESEKFDIAIIDANYKDTPCLELLTVLSSSQLNHNVQTIITTQNANRDQLGKFYSLGASYIFIKPYRLNLLEEKITQLSKPKTSDAGAFDPLIIKIFLESTIHIFDTVGHMNIEAGKPFLKSGNKSSKPVSAVIGLSSFQIRGALAICLEKDILKRFLLKILGNQARYTDTYLNDICGEICNQVMGRAKQQFLKKKTMSFEITVPTILSGAEHILDYKMNAPVLVIPFSYEKKQSIIIEFSLVLNTDPGDLIMPTEKTDVVVEEGELILF